MEDEVGELKILARDKKNNPLMSRLDWSENAIERVLRVPSGFMRDRTQGRIEELATERGLAAIELELVEEGIQMGLDMMKQMIEAQNQVAAAPKPSRMEVEEQLAATHGDAEPAVTEPSVTEPVVADATEAKVCPVAHDQHAAEQVASAEKADHASKSGGYVAGNNGETAAAGPTLNEISVLSEMQKRRDEVVGEGGAEA